MDLAGNSGNYEEDEPFIIDQEAPGSLKITYETEPVSSVMENLSLGFYNPSVTVTLSAEDDISGIDRFSWTYEQEDGTIQRVDLLVLLIYSLCGRMFPDAPVSL